MRKRRNTRRGFPTPIAVQAARALERSLRPWRKLQETLKESIVLSKHLNYTCVTATLEQQLEIVTNHLSPTGIHNSESPFETKKEPR